MDKCALMDIIAADLSNFVTDLIIKEEIAHAEDLFCEICKFEHLVKKEKAHLKKCVFCEKLNYTIITHF